MIKMFHLNALKIPHRIKLKNLFRNTGKTHKYVSAEIISYYIKNYWINPVHSGAILDTGFTNVSPYTVFLLSALGKDGFANTF